MTPEHVRLVVTNEPEACDWTRAGASIVLVPLLWNSHSCDCLRCSDHVDLYRIECDNGTMPRAWLGSLQPDPLGCFGEASGISGHCSCSAKPAGK